MSAAPADVIDRVELEHPDVDAGTWQRFGSVARRVALKALVRSARTPAEMKARVIDAATAGRIPPQDVDHLFTAYKLRDA